MNVEDNRGIAKTTDTAVPDLKRDVPPSHAIDHLEQILLALRRSASCPARVTCGGNRLADTKPNWARTSQ